MRVADPPGAVGILAAAGFVVSLGEDGVLTVGAVDDPATVTETLAKKRLYVSELAPVAVDLESVFLDLTRDTGDVADDPGEGGA